MRGMQHENMAVLGEFMKYPSAAQSSPSNKQQSSYMCICMMSNWTQPLQAYMLQTVSMVVLQTAPSKCVNVHLYTVPHESCVYQEPDCGMYQFGLKMGQAPCFVEKMQHRK